ncbi:MAG: restriction endonuclease subunit S, partial [Treponema sp.]|nr:restriction endonuclease subunit S [Candidatus Treponema scatequi]
MSRLDDLINKLCPDGVEYKTLGELGEFYGGLTGKGKNDFIDGNAKFITYMNVYKNLKLKLDVPEKVKINPDEKQRTLEYGDVLFTGSSETPDECGISSVLADKTDEKLYLNSFCICFRFNDPTIFNPEFSKYLFRSQELRVQIGKTASGVTRFNVSKEKMKKVIVPIVPLEIQNEIVRILDNFIKLEEGLEDELVVRRKQYEWAKQKFLNIKKENLVELQTVCRLEKGKTPIQKAIPGEYPLVVTTEKRSSCKDYQFDCKAVCLSLVSARGHGIAQISRIFYQEGKFALGNILCAMIPNDEKQLNAK